MALLLLNRITRNFLQSKAPILAKPKKNNAFFQVNFKNTKLNLIVLCD